MTPTCHLVSHTHWDREWYLSFGQFRARLVRMVDDLLNLLARDPEYQCFTLDGQAIVLKDCLTIKPKRAEEIRRLVAKGRLLIGPWYILPDEFWVSGEATIRNLLFGWRISQQFGVERINFPCSSMFVMCRRWDLYEFGRVTAREARAVGIHWTNSKVADLAV